MLYKCYTVTFLYNPFATMGRRSEYRFFSTLRLKYHPETLAHIGVFC